MNENLPTGNQFQRFRKYYTMIEPAWNKPKNRVYTAIIFSFLAISLFGWYAIRPTIQTIISLQKEIADKTVVSQKMDQKIESLIQARAELDALGPQLYLIDQAVPKNPDALDLSIQLRNLINESNATIAAMTVSKVPLTAESAANQKNAALKSSDFNVTSNMGGGYSSFENVLNNLNALRRLVSVQSFSIREPSGDELPVHGAGILILSLQLKSYYK